MKQMVFEILVMLLFSCAVSYANQAYDTTAKLPDDTQLWPIPLVTPSSDIITIKAEFIESKQILSVTQGNKTTRTYYIRYKVIEHEGDYPYDELTFIALDGWPAKGSGIVVKKLPSHFEKGEKTFYLKRNTGCKYKAFFEIVSYK